MSRGLLAFLAAATFCGSSSLALANEQGAITGGVGGAAVGAVVGGPVGAVVGGVGGAAIGASMTGHHRHYYHPYHRYHGYHEEPGDQR
jgi:hypothetical protein